MAFFAKYIEQVRKLLADNRQQPTAAAREARERFNATLQVNKLEQRRVLNADAVAALTDDVAAAQDSINVGDQGDVIDHALELQDSVNWDADGIDLNLTLNEHLNEFWAGLGEAGDGVANTSSDSHELLAAYNEFINSPEFAEALNGLVTNIFDTYGIEPGTQDPAASPDPQQLLDSVQTDVESIIPQHNWGTVEETTEQLTADILDHVSQHLADNTNPAATADSTYHAYAGGIDPQLVVEAVHTQIENLLTAHGIDPVAHQPAANSPAENPLQQTVVTAHDSVADAAALYNASIVESRITEFHNDVEQQVEDVQQQMTDSHVSDMLQETLGQVYDNVGVASTHNGNAASQPHNWSSTAAATTEATDSTEIIFVDSRVTNYQELVDGARDGVEVVALDPDRDGLEQIAEHLEGRDDIAAVHIVSHGSSGQLILGNSVITNENLDQYTAQLNAIGTSLTGNGDILFYGCDVGAGQRGADFLAAVASATSADVAASTDDTGAAALGGDWELEATVGLVNAGNAFTDATQQNYNYILPAVPASVDLTFAGGTLTFDQAGDDQADDLTVSYDDTTNELIITDANSTLDATAIAGAGVSGDASEIRIDLDDFAGTIDTIQVNGNGGDDSLTIDFSAANFLNDNSIQVNYAGGETGETNGDELNIEGGSFTSVTYNATAVEAGNLNLDGSAITFSELEPITMTSMAGTMTVNIDSMNTVAGPITTTVSDGGAGMTTVSTDVGLESITFANPTVELIINGDSMDDDTINVDGVGTGFNSALTIDTMGGGMVDDAVSVNTALSLGSAMSTGNVTLTSDDVNVNQAITTGGGNVVIDAGANVTGTVDGDITTTAAANSGTTSGSVTIRSALDTSGSIDLDGTIDTSGAANNAGTASNGGAVTLDATANAGGNADAADIRTTGGTGTGQPGGTGGLVDIDASGSVTLGTVNSSGGDGSAGGTGGVVTVDAVTTADAGTVNTSGGAGQTTGGDAGTVTVEGSSAFASSITAAGGAGTTGAGGAGANVSLQGTAGSNGNASVTSITTSGGSGTTGGDAGNVDIDGDSNVQIGGAITATGGQGSAAAGGAGGTVAATADSVSVGFATGSIDTSGGDGTTIGGNAGLVDLDANQNIALNSITANGGAGANGTGGNAANVFVTSDSSSVDVTTISASGGSGTTTGGDAGDVDVDGDQTLGTITAAGGTGGAGAGGAGGTVDLDATGNASVSVGAIDTSGGGGTQGGNAGLIDIDGSGRVNLNGAINATGGVGSAATGGTGGAVSVTAGSLDINGASATIDTSGGNGQTNGGNAGAVDLDSSNGEIEMDSITGRGGAGTTGSGGVGGVVTVDAGTVADAGMVDTSGGAGQTTGGNAGTVSVEGDSAFASSITAAGGAGTTDAGGAGADVSLQGTAGSSGSASVTAITTSGGSGTTGGDAGNVDLDGNNQVQIGGAITATGGQGTAAAGGAGGNVAATAASTNLGFATGSIDTSGGAGATIGGNAGLVDLDANQNIALNSITANGGNGATGGASGQVDVDAGDDITISTITANGGTGIAGAGGNATAGFTVTSTGGSVSITDINANGGNGATNGGNAATIDIDAQTNVNINGTWTALGGTGATAGTDGTFLITSNTGSILDGSGTEANNLVGGSAALRAVTGIGQDAADDANPNAQNINTASGTGGTFTLAAVTESGDINVRNTGTFIIGTVDTLPGVVINNNDGTATGNDNITLVAASSMQINSAVINNDGGNIVEAAQGAVNNNAGTFNAGDDDLQINADITAAGGNGNISLFAGGDILQTTGAISAAGAGAVNVSAGEDFNDGNNQAGSAVSDLLMTDGITIASATGQVELEATRNVALSSVTTGGTVIVSADDNDFALADGMGTITDNLTGEGAGNENVVAGSAAFLAGNGVGDGVAGDPTDIDTATDAGATTFTLAAETDTGDINISNTGSFTVGIVDGVTGVQIVDSLDTNGGGDITLRAASPMVINADVINNAGGDITEAAEGNVNAMVGTFDAADDDLQINANITATGGNGNINLFAGGDILQTTGTISTVGTGTILLSAGEDFNGGANQNGNANADIVMAEAAMITSDTGMVTLRATDDITLGQITSNGTVVVTADFDGVGGALADGTGAINDNAANTTADVTATTVTLTAATGIGNTNEIETAVSMLSADTTDGDIDIDNTLTTAVTVTSLTTGNNVAGTNIDFDQMGGGDVTFTGDVRSGGTPAATTVGGDITLRNLTAGANLTIGAGTTVTSENGSGGTLSIGGATIDGTVTVGAGNITIQGGILDTIIDAVLAGTGAIQVSALRDVIIRDEVSTTSGDITIMADSDDMANADPVLTNNFVRGGVLIEDAGLVDGPAAVTISGSNLYNDNVIEADGVADFTIESVRIDADAVAGTNQIKADGQIVIRSNDMTLDGATAPADADIIINGRIESTSTSITPATAPIRVTANEDVIFNNGAMAADNDGSLNTPGLVIVTATGGAIIDAEAGVEDSLITAAEAALRAETGIGDGVEGDAADIDTETDAGATTFTLAAETDSGDINIHNTGSVTVGTVDSLVGIQVLDTVDDNSGDDDITLVAASPITVDAAMINMDGGDIMLTAEATGAPMVPDDITINADIQVTDEAAMGDDGQIVVTADGGNIIHNTGTVSTVGGDNTSTSGRIQYNAAGIGGGAADGGFVTIGDTSTVNAAAEIITVDGNIDIDADTATANTTGVTIADDNGDALVSTTNGNITIDGTGFGDGTTAGIRGVDIGSGSTVESTGSGAAIGMINITGTGGAGMGEDDGVRITGVGTAVTSVDGDIDITGTSTTDDGVEISAGALVASTGEMAPDAAEITITGTSTSTAGNADGVVITGGGTTVRSIQGDITIDGETDGDDGVEISNTASIFSDDDDDPTSTDSDILATANIAITGTANGTDASEDGVVITTVARVLSQEAGNITITGTTAGGAGVQISNGANILSDDNADPDMDDSEAMSTGTIDINGTTTGSEDGVAITATGTRVSSAEEGNITIDGTANSSTADDGVEISGGAVVDSPTTDAGSAGITIQGTSSTTTGSNREGVLINGTDTTVMTAAADADIVINGTAGGDVSNNTGVEISQAAAVTATSGDITITGTQGGTPSGDNNDGILIASDADISGTGGTVTLTGTGGGTMAFDDNDGVQITGAGTTVTAETLAIDGTGNGDGSANDGVEISADADVDITDMGTSTITGSGAGFSDINGVLIDGAGTTLMAAGNVNIAGTGNVQGGGGGPDTIDGVQISGSADVTIMGTATIDGTGGGIAVNDGNGVFITGAGTTLTAGDTNITGTSSGNFNIDGVAITAGADVDVSTGNATIIGTGIGSNGGNNHGVLITGAGGGMDTTLTAATASISGTGDGTTTGNDGVEVSAAADITVSAGLDIDGTSGLNGTDDNRGVIITGSGTTVTHTGMTGAIDIDGTGGGTGRNNDGVEISANALVNSTGTAPIQIDGTGSINSTDGVNRGVEIDSAEVRSIDGDVSIIGTGGTGTTVSGSSNQGVRISLSDVRIDGMANVIVNGTAGEGTDADGRTTNGVQIFDSTIGDDDTVFGAMDLTGDATGFIILDANADQLDIEQSTIRTNADGEGTTRRILLSGNQIDISNGESATFIQALSQNGGQGEIVAAPDGTPDILTGDPVNVELGQGAADTDGGTGGDIFGLDEDELNTFEARVVRIGSADILAPGNTPTLTNQFGDNVNQDGTPMPPAPVDPMNPTIEERNMMFAQPYVTSTSSTISVVGNFTADSEFATDLFQLRTNGDSGTQTVAINPGSAVADLTVDLATNNPGRHFEAYAGLDITQEDADVLTASADDNDDRDIVDIQPTSVDGDPIFRDGDVHFFAERTVSITDTSTIATEDGEITLRGNQQTPATSGTFDGVSIVDSRVTTGTDTNVMTAAPTLGGDILIEGRAGDSMVASDQDGVFISNSTVESLRMDDPTDADSNGITEAGSITMVGLGGPGVDNNDGVEIVATSTISSVDGDITIDGTGGSNGMAGSSDNLGVAIGSESTVESIGEDLSGRTAASITISGIGGSGEDRNTGVVIEDMNTLVTSIDGNIEIDGTSNGTRAFNHGVQISNAAQVESTGMGTSAATITIDGTGGPGTRGNVGVFITLGEAAVTSVDGDIAISGTGGGDATNGESDNDGVIIFNTADVTATGTANITVTGTGNTGTTGVGRDSEGVTISGDGTTVTTNSGMIDVDGTGANGGTFDNEGVNVAFGALVGSTSGNITLDGTGGTGDDDNDGVQIDGADTRVTNVLGNITITGTAGSNMTADSDQNRGVQISNGAVVDSTGMDDASIGETAGTITIIGTGGPGEDFNDGVFIDGAGTMVTSVDGDIAIEGTGGRGNIGGVTEDDNNGVRIDNGAIVSSTGVNTVDAAMRTAANITIDGRGANGDDNNRGVIITGTDTNVTADEGNIAITGTGNSSFAMDSNDNHGVEIGSAAVVDTTSMGTDVGNITITGTGRGDGDNEGVRIHSTDTVVSTVDGDIMVTGSSTGFGEENEGVNIELGAVVRTTGAGDDAGNITVKGQGSGTNSGEGVLIEGMGTIVDVVDGDIMVVGRSEATGDGNEGVEIQDQARVESLGVGMNAGTISLDGIGTGLNDSEGVLITGTDTLVTSVDGDITIMGDTIAVNDNNEGVEVGDGAVVRSTGMGDMAANITIHGFTGVCDEGGEGGGFGGVPINDSEAVLITGAGSTVSAVDGDIEIIGINNSTGIDNAAVEVSDSGLVDATGDGTINIAGLDNNNNFGDPGVLIDGPTSTVSSNTGIITITAAALNDNGEPEVAGNLQMDNAGRVLSNEADINLNSTNDVQLGIVNADADNAGASGTVFVIADAPATFDVPVTGMMGGGEGGGENWICLDPAMTTSVTIDPNGFGAIGDNLATEDANITAAATSLVAADGIGAGEHTVDLTTGLPATTDDADIDTNVATLAAFNGSNIDGSHDNDGNINVENQSGELLTLDTVGTTVGVQNQGTGDNDDATPGGDISILNNDALDIGPAGVVNDNGGRIIITAASTGALDGDLGIRGDVAITNGIGSIMLNGGDNVDFGPGNTISTDTLGSDIDINAIQGDVRGDFVSAGSTTLIQTAEGTAVRGKPVIISSDVPQIDIFGTTTLTATFGTPGETNLLWTIDWGDGTVEEFVVDAGTHTRSHTYTENPSGNDADPIPVNFDVEHDDSIAVDGFVGQPNPSASPTIDYTINSALDFAETPGTGFGATVFVFDSNSPALSFPETATATGLDNIIETSTLEQIDNSDRVVPGESTAAEDEKLVLRLTLPSGEKKDFPLPNDILEGDNVKVLWKRLTDGRYQIVLIREDGTERIVLTVEVRGGRAIIRNNKPSTEQDSTNNNKEESKPENGNGEANQQNGEAAPDEMSRLPQQPADPVVAPVPVETATNDADVESVSEAANAAVSRANIESTSDMTDNQERPTVSAAALFGSAIAYRSLRRGSSAHGEWDEQVETALAKSAERSLGRAARLRRQLLR